MDTPVLAPVITNGELVVKQLTKSTIPEPSPIPVFNRTDGVLGYSFPEYKDLDLEPGRWTTDYPLPPGVADSPFAKNYPPKPIPRAMVTQYLQHDPNISTQIPYRQFSPSDFKNITIAAAYHNVTGWGRTSAAITHELIKLREKPRNERIEEEYNPPKTWSFTPEYPDVDLTLYPVTHWNYTDLPDNVRDLMRKPHQPTPCSVATAPAPDPASA